MNVSMFVLMVLMMFVSRIFTLKLNIERMGLKSNTSRGQKREK